MWKNRTEHTKSVGEESNNYVIGASTPDEDRGYLSRKDTEAMLLTRILTFGITDGEHEAIKNRVKNLASIFTRTPKVSDWYKRVLYDFD